MPEYLRADIASLFDDWRPGTPPARLSAALFDGALIVMRGLEPVERLCRRARTLVEEAFETSDPVRAENCMAPAAFQQAAVRARKAVEQDTEEMPHDTALPVLIEPGALLAFSAAHLHASTTDVSGLCRFSIDTRSIWADDLSTGRGAPNVDSYARRAHWEWFSRPSLG